jgi:hypothetical protein
VPASSGSSRQPRNCAELAERWCCLHAEQKQRDASGTEVLSRLDKLFVVHVVKEGKKEKEKDKGDKWCVGGPLLPPMRVALAKFPHEVIELEVRRLPYVAQSLPCMQSAVAAKRELTMLPSLLLLLSCPARNRSYFAASLPHAWAFLPLAPPRLERTTLAALRFGLTAGCFRHAMCAGPLGARDAAGLCAPRGHRHHDPGCGNCFLYSTMHQHLSTHRILSQVASCGWDQRPAHCTAAQRRRF